MKELIIDGRRCKTKEGTQDYLRSEEHTSELQSLE